MSGFDDFSEEQQEAIKSAVDELAMIYPLEQSRAGREQWWKWLTEIVEMRAKRLQQ